MSSSGVSEHKLVGTGFKRWRIPAGSHSSCRYEGCSALPGLAGGVGPQLFDRHQYGAAVPFRQRRAFAQEFWESLGLAQVHLDVRNVSLRDVEDSTSRRRFPPSPRRTGPRPASP